jgi:hypothetical protein
MQFYVNSEIQNSATSVPSHFYQPLYRLQFHSTLIRRMSRRSLGNFEQNVLSSPLIKISHSFPWLFAFIYPSAIISTRVSPQETSLAAGFSLQIFSLEFFMHSSFLPWMLHAKPSLSVYSFKLWRSSKYYADILFLPCSKHIESRSVVCTALTMKTTFFTIVSITMTSRIKMFRDIIAAWVCFEKYTIQISYTACWKYKFLKLL